MTNVLVPRGQLLFLKSMEIFGFKSFADRSRIEFTPGITALLGPNGCGKSNVVDALKWVLGEQASKSLRADKMEDVIFNGTETRKSLGVAEVSLTMSNEEHVLDLDVAEICVKRRLYRSGESEYYVNNAQVKLKELRELFYDTGVGKSAYSVMEQGRIDQILSTKPEERRYLFEEAAGITKYRFRGQEAERKLEKTEENLRQIEGILGEVRRSRDLLQKQAEKTQTYRTLRQEIFELEKKQQLRRLKNFELSGRQIEDQISEKTAKRQQVQEDLNILNRNLEAGLAEVNALEESLILKQKEIFALDIEKSNLESQVRIQVERRSHHENQMALGQSRAVTLANHRDSLSSEIDRCANEQNQLKVALKEVQMNIELFEANIETARLELQDHAERILKNESDLKIWEVEENQIQTALQEVTTKLVTELDHGMKSVPDWSKLPGVAQNLDQQFASVKIILAGRTTLLESVTSAKKWPENDAWDFLSKLMASLQDVLRQVDSGQDLWQTFKNSVPYFLLDFVAPEGIITQKNDWESRFNEGATKARSLRDENRDRHEKMLSLQKTIESYRNNLEELKIGRERQSTQIRGFDQTILDLHKRLNDQRIAITDNERDNLEHHQRRSEIDQELVRMTNLQNQIQQNNESLRLSMTQLETVIQQKNQFMAGNEHEIKACMEKLRIYQSEVEQTQIQQVRIQTEVRALLDHFKDKHSVDLADFVQSDVDLSVEESESASLSGKRDELKSMGQVNLMAVEEFVEVDERFKFLTGQLDDLKKARDDLHKITFEIKKESVVLFEQTFHEVKKHFHQIFRRLFGGGRADLRLSDPQNILESGIEILCQPPGKKLESINLLSGGEKSMTAVALLFATFVVKPSPFCILDEIDAALDESNVGRFIGMLTEFSKSSQFIVITHNKRTVTSASTMIGVTMDDPGISKIVAVRLGEGSQRPAVEDIA